MSEKKKKNPPTQDVESAQTAETQPAQELTEAELLAQAQQLAEQLAGEKEELFQQHIRLQADFDNFRKRIRQEQADLVKMATSGLIQELLPVLDNFERALSALPESNEREGVQLIFRQFMEALSTAGLTPIEAVGADFDPQMHEAVLQTEAGEEQKGKVLAEAQKGYLLHGKLLRPARVQVGC